MARGPIAQGRLTSLIRDMKTELSKLDASCLKP